MIICQNNKELGSFFPYQTIVRPMTNNNFLFLLHDRKIAGIDLPGIL